MDALSLLTEDHRKVRELFQSARELGPRAYRGRADVFERIDRELTVHTKIEEKIFYPALKEKAEDREDREKILEAFEEHAVAERLIRELEGLESEDERYKAKLKVLMESVEHHADEEEQTLFPLARKLFEPDELERLGEELEAEKARFNEQREKVEAKV